MSKRPDFFIVGAPKCGTSSMHDYLRQHPDVCMSPIKEPHYFGDELESMRAVRTQRDYMKLYRDAGSRVAGDTSPNYLFYRSALEQILAFNPEGRFIIMLRNPVDFLHSYHNQQLYNLIENIEDFEEALAAEPERAQGRRLPSGCQLPDRLLYRHRAQFSQFLAVYFELCRRDHVKVLLLDDLKRDAAAAYRDVLRFIGVDETFVPDLRVVNPSQKPRSRILHHIINHRQLRAAGKRILPDVMCVRMGQWALRANARPSSRKPISSDLRERLRVEFKPEIQRLEEMLGRDLRSWYQPMQSAGSAAVA